MADFPTRELGGTGNTGVALPGTAGWGAFIHEGEHVPELTWPNDVVTYERMLTDSQVWSLYSGLVLTLLEYDWALDANGADPDATQRLAADLGLPVGLPDAGEERQIAPGLFRFNFLEHLSEALFALAYGHYYFEQVGEVAEEDGRPWWHLRQLAPRAPQTIAAIDVDRGGGLRAIRQTGVTSSVQAGTLYMGQVPPIPVTQLVAYVWMGDARRRWIGRSMLRSLFQPWLLKDVLLRTDVVNHQRAGGVPYVETDEQFQGMDLDELAAIAQEFKVDEEGGAALPPGAKLKLARAGGTDIIGSVRYHDESMARVWHGMVRQLGQTETGSRALGGTFADLEALARRAVSRWFRGVFREHVIEDWWTWNLGTDAQGRPLPHPLLVCRPPSLEGTDSAADPATPATLPNGLDPQQAGLEAQRLAQAFQNGVITAPEARRRLEAMGMELDDMPAELREVANPAPPAGEQQGGGGPPMLAAAARPSPRPGAAAAARRRRRAEALVRCRAVGAVAAAGELTLPDRPLRREPTDREVAAAVDYATLDAAYEDVSAAVLDLWENTWLPVQVEAVRDAIRASDGTPEELAVVRAPAVGADDLTDALLEAARSGVSAAEAELTAQGVTGLDTPADDVLRARIAGHAEAVAQQTADGLSLAASRRAVQLAGELGAGADDIAAGVVDYLNGLTHQWERDQLTGAVQQAQNAGRFETFTAADDEPLEYSSSELLDEATCEPCADEDGTVYDSLEDATAAYPSGGFVDCDGGPRCRGTAVAVLREL